MQHQQALCIYVEHTSLACLVCHTHTHTQPMADTAMAAGAWPPPINVRTVCMFGAAHRPLASSAHPVGRVIRSCVSR